MTFLNLAWLTWGVHSEFGVSSKKDGIFNALWHFDTLNSIKTSYYIKMRVLCLSFCSFCSFKLGEWFYLRKIRVHSAETTSYLNIGAQYAQSQWRSFFTIWWNLSWQPMGLYTSGKSHPKPSNHHTPPPPPPPPPQHKPISPTTTPSKRSCGYPL